MRAVLQRAASAQVVVGDSVVGTLPEPGIVALVGVHVDDTDQDAKLLARKIAELRILEGEKSLEQVGAPALLVSQFTLYGQTKKGRRPSWSEAAKGEQAEPLFNLVVEELQARGIRVDTGVFGAYMQVSLVNDGPFTVLVETRSDFPRL